MCPTSQERQSAVSCSALSSCTVRICLKHRAWKTSKRDSRQVLEPPELAPFHTKELWFYCEHLPNDWAPHPIWKAEPKHSLKEAHFHSLPAGSHSFSHTAHLAAIGDCRNADQPVNQQLCLLTQCSLHCNRLPQCHCWHRIDAYVSLQLCTSPTLSQLKMIYLICPMNFKADIQKSL